MSRMVGELLILRFALNNSNPLHIDSFYYLLIVIEPLLR